MIDDSPNAHLIIDYSVQDRGYARSIEMVKLQYSGTEGGLVCGMGILNLIFTRGEAGAYCPLDFRIYTKEIAEKGKRTLGPGWQDRPERRKSRLPGMWLSRLGAAACSLRFRDLQIRYNSFWLPNSEFDSGFQRFKVIDDQA